MTDRTERWQAIMNQAYDKWQAKREWKYREFLLNLDALERKAVVLGNFNHQVLNGGLQQWVDNGYATGSGRDLLLILEEIGTELAKKVKAIVEEVLGYVDMDAEPQGWGDYWQDGWVDDDHLACYEEIDKLTDDYYTFYEDFEAEVERYLTALPCSSH